MFFLALSGRPAAFVFSLVALLDILEGCTRAPAVVKKKKEKMKEKRRQKERQTEIDHGCPRNDILVLNST